MPAIAAASAAAFLPRAAGTELPSANANGEHPCTGAERRCHARRRLWHRRASVHLDSSGDRCALFLCSASETITAGSAAPSPRVHSATRSEPAVATALACNFMHFLGLFASSVHALMLFPAVIHVCSALSALAVHAVMAMVPHLLMVLRGNGRDQTWHLHVRAR